VAADSGGAKVDIGVPEGFTFLFLFDFHSVMQRKNPHGLIEAFKRAFAPGEGPQLVIKSINGDARPRFLEQLKVATLDRDDIFVVDEYLSAKEKTALMAGCDCYVSLHRSEGFGLTPAEAMSVGKPVIATGFSGTADYMNSANSYLVDYTMVEVGEGSPPYEAYGTWAAPNLDHAAALMRRVWENPQEASAKGERARRDIEENKLMRARLELPPGVPAATPEAATPEAASPPSPNAGGGE
jgi:glycosyltransferase involved in cell wall biosynthesis